MSIYNIVAVVGGLAFFLFGMTLLSSGLKKVAGDRLEFTLQKMTNHPLKGLAFGAMITIAMQSSSALTVMLVGLVNSGIMTLTQTVGIIMGSNIGTTLTAWILSLSGVQTDNILIAMMKPENFSPVLALIGVILMMAAKEQKKKDLGAVLVGFAILMHGMEMMSDSLSPLAEVPEFANILTAFRNPFLGVLVGAIFTGVIQSSAASVGILQALSLTGHITYGTAIPIIMGQNIGTCVTALLSSIGVSKNAKRVSVIHISFNMIGTALGLVIYLLCDSVFQLSFFDKTITPFAIAAFHSIFNVATTLVLLPFTKVLVKIAEHAVIEEGAEESFLDERLLISPPLAAAECRKKASLIMQKSAEGFIDAMALTEDYNDDMRESIKILEKDVDEMVEACNKFLIKLSSSDVSKEDTSVIADMLHGLGDMERISDYSLNLSATAKKMNRSEFKHRKVLKAILRPINTGIKELLDMTVDSYTEKDKRKAVLIHEKAEALVHDIKKLKKSDLKSLRNGKGEAEASVYLSDYLSICRRVAEHSDNIAESLL